MPVRLGVVALMILGCSGFGTDAQKDTGDGPTGPLGGTYVFEAVDVTTDCPDEDPRDPESSTAEIEVAEDGRSMTYEDVACSLDGAAFTCVFVDEDVDYSESGMDAVISMRAVLEGEWTSESSIEATSESYARCEGGDCDALEEMGSEFCSSTVELVGTLQ